MRCEQAQQLFDAHLQGELSPTLEMELGAHRLECPDCRRALALLEVSGHVIASDTAPDPLDDNFTDRLIACMGSAQSSWFFKLRRGLYIGGPLAAAAVVALAFLGMFDRHETKVLGEKVNAPNVGVSSPAPHDDAATPEARRLDDWLKQTQENMDVKRKSGESLHEALDLTAQQLLDALKRAQQAQGRDASSDAAVEPNEAGAKPRTQDNG